MCDVSFPVFGHLAKEILNLFVIKVHIVDLKIVHRLQAQNFYSVFICRKSGCDCASIRGDKGSDLGRR